MNNGHTNPPANLLNFPTPDNPEANNNLDLTNPETNWDEPVSIEHDEKALGSEALRNNFLEMPPSEPEKPELGKIYTPESLEPINRPTEEATSDTDILKESLAPKLSILGETEDVGKEGAKVFEEITKKIEEDPALGYDMARGEGGALDEKMRYHGENSAWPEARPSNKTGKAA